MTTLPRIAVVAGFAAALAAAPLDAQEAPDRWRSQVELGFTGASGNSSYSILRTGGSIKWLQTDLAEFEVSALVRYGKSEERTIADDQRLSLKGDWKPESDFSPFVFFTATRDAPRRIDFRSNSGAGAKWTFWRAAEDPGNDKASFSLAALWDHENFDVAPGSDQEEIQTAARWSARLKFDHTFGENAKFAHVTFFQPEFTDIGDYVIEMTNSLSTRLLSNLNLVVEHELIHDAVPPPDVESRDQKFSVVLRVSL